MHSLPYLYSWTLGLLDKMIRLHHYLHLKDSKNKVGLDHTTMISGHYKKIHNSVAVLFIIDLDHLFYKIVLMSVTRFY